MAYFSNGSEGEVLDQQCFDCPITGYCPVLFIQLEYNYVQVDEGQENLRRAMNKLINEQGICQVRQSIKDSKLSRDYAQLQRKVAHGCTDASCSQCDED